MKVKWFEMDGFDIEKLILCQIKARSISVRKTDN
jgi:hypothetical protein